jgi:hypothetical protein
MLEASAGGMDRRNQILRQNWFWNRSVGMRSGRRGARRQNVRILPKRKRGASCLDSRIPANDVMLMLGKL